MQSIVIRAISFLLMVSIAFTLKKLGILKKEDGYALSRVMMNITLPCVIINSFGTTTFSGKLLIFILVGLGVNFILLLISFLFTRNASREDKIYYTLCLPAYNIGCFTFPFASSMLGPQGALTVCLVDSGNSFQCLGLDYAITKAMVDNKRVNVLSMLKPLLRVPSFVCYIIFIPIALVGIKLPSEIFTFTSLVANANGPIAMFMIGLLLEPTFDKNVTKKVLNVILIRYSLAAILGLIIFNTFPFSYEIRKAAVIVLFSPISSASPSFTLDLNGNTSLASTVNSISIMVSIILIPLLVIML